MNEILVIGFGSELLSDEGIVARLINQVSQKLKNVDFKQFATVSLDLLDELSGYKKIIILDSVKTTGGYPGRVETYPVQEYRPTNHLENMHDISLPILLQSGRLLDYEITREIQIITIEIMNYTTISNNLSEEITKVQPSIFHQVYKMLEDECDRFSKKTIIF